MATYRCPKHDVLFDTLTDSRKPGALAVQNFPAHPANCHPDCPQRETVSAESVTASTSIRVSNRKVT